jgi:diacylglycerol kinase family enzyme
VRLPLIAILRGGTMNTMGRNIGLRLAADDLLGKVVVGYHAEQPLRTVERNLMVVNGTEAGFLFGTGLPARFLEAYYEGGDAGPWKAVTTLTRAIWSSIIGGPFAQSLFALEPCRVKVDGQEWEPSAYATVLGGTTADMGIGVNGGAMSVVSKLHRIRLALPFSGPGITDQVARRFTIEADHPISYMIDGDFLRAGQTLTVEAGPRVRFIVG